ncbi:MAG: serine hydrolase domain-containing protein [Sporichthyaceae bacterium]
MAIGRRPNSGVRSAAAAVALTVLAGGLGTLGGPPAAASSPPACEMTRTGDYERTAPELAGLDPAKLAAALDYAALMGSQSIKVFRRGCLLGEGVRDAMHDRIPSNNWGQAKTVVALLTSIAVDRGWVRLDEPIARHLPPDLGDRAHRNVTLRHLLTASSGAQVNQVRGLNFLSDVSRVRDWFAQPITRKPGTYYFYDQAAVSVIVYVTERAISAALGRDVDYQEFAQHELFDNLGIPASAYFWQRDRTGTTSGYSQLFMRPLEFARLAQLIAQRGFFDDKQVISTRSMKAFRAPSKANCGYAFLTFLNSCKPGQNRVNVGVPTRDETDGAPWIASAPANMIFTDGVGTRLWVIPGLDMVITRNGEQEFDTVPSLLTGDLSNVVPGRLGAAGTHEFFRLLMAAVTDMPAKVRASIANSGAYAGAPTAGFDPVQYLNQPSAFPESYFGFGLPGQCTPLGCAGESNDGGAALLMDIPRTGPGVFGLDSRPDGSAPLR